MHQNVGTQLWGGKDLWHAQGLLITAQSWRFLRLAQIGVANVHQQLDGQQRVCFSRFQVVRGSRMVQVRHGHCQDIGLVKPLAYQAKLAQYVLEQGNLRRGPLRQPGKTLFISLNGVLDIAISFKSLAQAAEEGGGQARPFQRFGQRDRPAMRPLSEKKLAGLMSLQRFLFYSNNIVIQIRFTWHVGRLRQISL